MWCVCKHWKEIMSRWSFGRTRGKQGKFAGKRECVCLPWSIVFVENGRKTNYCRVRGAVSRKTRSLTGPEKQFLKLWPTCFRYKGRQNNFQVSNLEMCSYWSYKGIYVTRRVSGLSRNGPQAPILARYYRHPRHRVSWTRLKSKAQILPNNIVRHSVSVSWKKTKIKQDYITEFVLLSNTAELLATWLAVRINGAKEKLVSDVFVSIAWLFSMILHCFA